MTSYSAMAARGRAAAAERAGEPFRRIVKFEVREVTRTTNVVGIDGKPRPDYVMRIGEYIGECGHALYLGGSHEPQWRIDHFIGRRKRCPQCPKIEPKPVPDDHCLYEWETEFGEERTCATRGRYANPDYELLCLKHARWLQEWSGDEYRKL